jgi:hypothetical protein
MSMLARLAFSFRAPVFISAFALLFLSACSGGPRVADAASIAEAKKVPPPVMQAEAGFFEGKLLVEVNLGRGFRPRMVRSNAKFDRDIVNGTSVFTAPFGTEFETEEDVVNNSRIRNSSLPPVALRLRVHNTTTAPVEVEFLECKSYLGNFAVRPEKITIAAGESGQPDAMVSLLGVSGSEIPVTIRLRLDGKTETHTTILVPVAKTAPVAPKPEKS